MGVVLLCVFTHILGGSKNVHGKEEIVAVRTFRSRLPVRRVRHMDRRGQEVQNNFLTDHIIKFLSGSPVRPSRRALRASCTGTVVVHRIP